MAEVDFTKVVLGDAFVGEDEEETVLVRELLHTAEGFLSSFDWCAAIRESYAGLAIGGVVGVFLFRIEPARDDVDEWLWVIVGDVPPAYLVTDEAPNPACALDSYLGEMERWVAAVKEGRATDELIPVLTSDGAWPLEPTAEHAEMLETRLRFLDERVVAAYADDLSN